VSGKARVLGEAQVFGEARVLGEARVSGKARVFDEAWVSGEAWVFGEASQTPVCVSGMDWHVTILDSQMQIGCQFHSLAEWENFTNAEIAAMDGKKALRFWEKHRDFLLSIRKESLK
jgi:hypothetical protein